MNTNASGAMRKDGRNAPSRPTRRHVLTMATALAIPLLPRIGKAAPITFPVPTTTILIPPTESPSSSTSQDETYTGDALGLTVTWDPDLWQVRYEPVAGTDGITLVDTNVDVNDTHADKYYFQIGYVTKEHWTTVAAVQQNAIDDWFNLGMLNATIIQEWVTTDAYGFFYTSHVQNKQSLYYMEYSAVDPSNAVWRWLTTAIDSAIFNVARTRTLFAAVTVDNEAIPRAVDADTLITLFSQHAV